jgi:hypothetical protein
MTSLSTFARAACACLILAAACLPGRASHAGPAAPPPPVPGTLSSFPAKDLRWIDIPGSGGIRYANVSGNLAGKGPYEAFVVFPAGKANPFHLHTQALPTVVLKGSFYAIVDGKRVDYPAGSFYRLPARLPHHSGCAEGEDCLLFQYQADAFDLQPLDGEG